MLSPFKTLMRSLASLRSRHACMAKDDGRLETIALLIRVATVDGQLSEARRARLDEVAKNCFRLEVAAMATLVDRAAVAERDLVDLYHFTRRLNGVLDHAGRRAVVRMMWEVLCAGGRISAPENNVVWRAADLLAVSGRERIELRQHAAANMRSHPRYLVRRDSCTLPISGPP